MKVVKILAVLLLIYVGIVVTFESLLGYFQPANESTLVLTTTDADGTNKDRVLAARQSGGELYVSVNHWPRAWYYRTLDNPYVQVTKDGQTGAYLAVPLTPEEVDEVKEDLAVGLGFRFLTGFPPRYFLRLEPEELTSLPDASEGMSSDASLDTSSETTPDTSQDMLPETSIDGTPDEMPEGMPAEGV